MIFEAFLGAVLSYGVGIVGRALKGLIKKMKANEDFSWRLREAISKWDSVKDITAPGCPYPLGEWLEIKQAKAVFQAALQDSLAEQKKIIDDILKEALETYGINDDETTSSIRELLSYAVELSLLGMWEHLPKSDKIKLNSIYKMITDTADVIIEAVKEDNEKNTNRIINSNEDGIDRVIKRVDELEDTLTKEKPSTSNPPVGQQVEDSPVNNLPGQNLFFTGRGSVMNKISAGFASGKAVSLVQTISGMG